MQTSPKPSAAGLKPIYAWNSHQEQAISVALAEERHYSSGHGQHRVMWSEEFQDRSVRGEIGVACVIRVAMGDRPITQDADLEYDESGHRALLRPILEHEIDVGCAIRPLTTMLPPAPRLLDWRPGPGDLGTDN